MPRTEEANQRIREEQRAKILNAARRVFAQKGMGATMADVAAEAEVSQGLAYRYFASKEALFQALIEQIVQPGPALIQRLLEAPGTPGERLALLISRQMEGRSARLEIFQLLYHVMSDQATPKDLRQLLGGYYQTFLGVMKQLIVEGQATGEVAEGDPDQMVAVVSACLDGLTRWAVRHPEQYKENPPDAGLILRILKPCPDQRG